MSKSIPMKQKSVAAVTLGCKVNYAETSSIVDMLVSEGWAFHDIDDGADIIFIHTCAVTGEAERKSRQQIRKAIKKHPNAKVLVAGCYAQLAPEQIAQIDGVSLVLGMSEKFDRLHYPEEPDQQVCDVRVRVAPVEALAVAHVASSLISQPDKGRTRAFLKIQDGCSFGCAYCAIPLARGRSRSVPLATVIERAVAIAEAGYREIVLTGINIADYHDGQHGFTDLLRHLEELDVSRIRISSIEPQFLDDELIALVAGSTKIMPHFHLPLQSGSNKVLKAMGRQYDTAFYRERLLRAVSSIRGCVIGADVMVGYPGESEDDFEAMYRFIEALPVAYLHIFSCSVRSGTRLFREIAEKKVSRVVSAEASRRAKRLAQLGQQLERRFASSFIGRQLRVLFEEGIPDGEGRILWSGYSENYLRVQVKIDDSAHGVSMRGVEHEVFIDGVGEGLLLQGRLVF
ncbi:MAG TPA: tRNA (N(6)-L-threonylcarbamoyladenosine(37)-C(2))-methylthiotransferase MtaB [Chlorobaculum parvum]|uniref:tRNA (N(6)-L-threonylcarbamoyladenosine(37)-C(2))-methylthiotransferase MtaB n=1 Tax=Chlorobaculum parvum TaxID=274539 RepID=A0A7C5DF31_9CHLB|nr:tRNA (N(6)-L-threonylcarbamoyladenosine(37)-C(2))-methylthiotransferase MtaB [Chlorobaculum parvum]